MRAMWARDRSARQPRAREAAVRHVLSTSRLLRHASYWLLRNRDRDLPIETAVRELRAGVQALDDSIDSAMTGSARAPARHRARRAHRRRRAGEAGTAHRAPVGAGTRVRHRGAGAQRARRRCRRWRRPTSSSASRWASTGCTWKSTGSPVDGSWQATARTGLRDAAMRAHRELTQQVLHVGGARRIADRLARWTEARSGALTAWQRTLTEMRSVGAADFATLTVGVDAVRSLAGRPESV